MLRLFLTLTALVSMVTVSSACTCEPMDFQAEFCDDLDRPVVALKIIPEKKNDRSKRAAMPRTTASPAPTTSSTGERIVTVSAKVTKIYRQGTDVQATKGQRVYISSSEDDGMCGIASRLREGKTFITKISSYDRIVRYMCDFFIDISYHSRIGNPNKYFKKKNLCREKKKKGKKNKGKKGRN